MKSRSHPLLPATLFGVLLAAAMLLAARPTQAAIPTAGADPAMPPAPGGPATGEAIIYPTAVYTVPTVVISNEPPGRLIDDLYARLGHTNFAVALGYLKDHSNGIISQEWYDHLINDPASLEASLTLLRDYTSPFSGTVEVGEDGTVAIWNTPFQDLSQDVYILLDGRHFANVPGWTLSASQNGQFSLTYAQDPTHYVHTHTYTIGYNDYKYCAFAIAWRKGHTVFLPVVVRNSLNLPSNPSPANGATNQSLDVDLSWTGGDPGGGAVTYDVYFEAGDSTPDVLLCDGVIATICDPGTLVTATLYYWQVVATDEHLAITSGPVWHFTTSAGGPPPAILILGGKMVWRASPGVACGAGG